MADKGFRGTHRVAARINCSCALMGNSPSLASRVYDGIARADKEVPGGAPRLSPAKRHAKCAVTVKSNGRDFGKHEQRGAPQPYGREQCRTPNMTQRSIPVAVRSKPIVPWYPSQQRVVLQQPDGPIEFPDKFNCPVRGILSYVVKDGSKIILCNRKIPEFVSIWHSPGVGAWSSSVYA
jgi:hypothetical protein